MNQVRELIQLKSNCQNKPAVSTVGVRTYECEGHNGKEWGLFKIVL